MVRFARAMRSPKHLRWQLLSRRPCSSRAAQQAELDREPESIGIGAVTIDQIALRESIQLDADC